MMVAFDTETTGIEPGSRLVQIAGVLFDHETGIIDTFERLVNPGMPMPADAGALNGVTNEMLADAPDAKTALADFWAWVPAYATMVTHYARFDTGVVSWEMARCGMPEPEHMVIDTWGLAKAIGATKDNKLLTLVGHYNIQLLGQAHRALVDADACRQYLEIAQKILHSLPVERWAQAGHDYSYTENLPEALEYLPALISAGSPLNFTYDDGKGARTERSITPYGWAEKGGVIYFHGHDHMRDARRTFRCDRVVSVEGQ